MNNNDLINYIFDLKKNNDNLIVIDKIGYSNDLIFNKIKFYYCFFKENDVNKGDTVSLFMLNSIDWICIFFAAICSGINLNLVNTRYKKSELEYTIDKSKSDFVFTEERDKLNFFELVKKSNVRVKKIFYLSSKESENDGFFINASNYNIKNNFCFRYEDVLNKKPNSLIFFSTSGSTSGPKLVMHNRFTLTQHARDCALAYYFDESNVNTLLMLPLSGVFGLNVFLMAFIKKSLIYIESIFNENETIDYLNNYNITHTYGSDEMVRRIIELNNSSFKSLKFFGFGAFTSNFKKYAQKVWSKGVPLYGLYGSSEVQAIFSRQLSTVSIDERIEGGGFPVAHHASVRIRSLESDLIITDNSVGEIEIKSETLFLGYFENEEETKKVFTLDSYFKTGDVGHMRNDGSFVYLSRKGEVIRLGGYLVNPTEVEFDIKALPGVSDSQVVALNNENIGNFLAAFIIKEPYEVKVLQLTEQTVQQQLKKQIASYKIPKFIFFIDEFPQINSPNGKKVDRKKLREMVDESIHN